MKRFIYVLFSFLFLGSSWAQDVHFSQFDNSPMTLNPALAGAHSTFQGIAMYRGQYGSFTSPYKTFAASMDGQLSAGMKKANGIIGGGLNFYNDRMGNGYFAQSTVGLNVSYNLKITRFSRVALGLNTTFGQCATNPAQGQWGSQYDGTAFNASLQSGESFYAQNLTYFDVGAGLVYSYQTNVSKQTNEGDKGFSVGLAAYHLNNPRFSFYNSSIQTIPVRISGFANANFAILAANGIIQPSVCVQNQKKSLEVQYGFYYKQLLKEASTLTELEKEISFSIGFFSRFKDAFIIKSQIQYGPLSAGFAYDINTSRLSLVSNFKGGFETFLKYNINTLGGKKVRVKP